MLLATIGEEGKLRPQRIQPAGQTVEERPPRRTPRESPEFQGELIEFRLRKHNRFSLPHFPHLGCAVCYTARIMVIEITSHANPRIKEVYRMRQRSHRDDAGKMIVEGYREIHRALDHGYRPTALFFCEELWLKHENEPTIVRRCEELGAQLLSCSRRAFEWIAYRERPDGLLAVGPQVACKLSDIPLPADALVLVCESIEKPGNLGTMLRSADASGASAVIVCDPCTDIHNPNVVRASTGTLFTLPVAVATAQETIAWLKANNFGILAATPHAEKLYFEQDLTGRVALCLGSEQYGLTETFMKDAGLRVRIPMLGVADSLNVSAAGNILLSEVVRQRILAGTVTPPPAEPWHGEGTHDQ